MSLTRNLEQAFLDNKYGRSVDVNSLSSAEKSNISILAEDMADAIAEFITAQTFKITRMVADVEMDEIKTASPIQGEVLEVDTQVDTNVDVTSVNTTVTGQINTYGAMIPGASGTGTGKGTGRGTGEGKTSPVMVGGRKSGASGPGLVLKKLPGGQGGKMTSAGKATVGRRGMVDFNTETEVKLDPNDIQKI